MAEALRPNETATDRPLRVDAALMFIGTIRTPWSMKKTIALLASQREAYGVREPTRAAPSAGRNEPCPCGSGQKRKRCCLPA